MVRPPVRDRMPIEDAGGPRTRLSHRRETVFDGELMTMFLNWAAHPFSLITVASLEDLGYGVEHGASEVFQ